MFYEKLCLSVETWLLSRVFVYRRELDDIGLPGAHLLRLLGTGETLSRRYEWDIWTSALVITCTGV